MIHAAWIHMQSLIDWSAEKALCNTGVLYMAEIKSFFKVRGGRTGFKYVIRGKGREHVHKKVKLSQKSLLWVHQRPHRFSLFKEFIECPLNALITQRWDVNLGFGSS